MLPNVSLYAWRYEHELNILPMLTSVELRKWAIFLVSSFGLESDPLLHNLNIAMPPASIRGAAQVSLRPAGKIRYDTVAFSIS